MGICGATCLRKSQSTLTRTAPSLLLTAANNWSGESVASHSRRKTTSWPYVLNTSATESGTQDPETLTKTAPLHGGLRSAITLFFKSESGLYICPRERRIFSQDSIDGISRILEPLYCSCRDPSASDDRRVVHNQPVTLNLADFFRRPLFELRACY